MAKQKQSQTDEYGFKADEDQVAADGAATTAQMDAAIAASEQNQNELSSEGETTEVRNNDGDVVATTSTAPADRHLAPLQPGDDGYDPMSDPVIPSSSLAGTVQMELDGSGESPTRDALVAAQKQA